MDVTSQHDAPNGWENLMMRSNRGGIEWHGEDSIIAFTSKRHPVSGSKVGNKLTRVKHRDLITNERVNGGKHNIRAAGRKQGQLYD
tara:strand:- start:13224 stop:13481 length:258 start_codon:yes stop_codon:yes gene_type:complete